ncbi:MAG: NAD(+) diphosphatase [Cyanobacteria bacterium J06560_2]
MSPSSLPQPCPPNPFAISEQFQPATAPHEPTDAGSNTWWFVCRGSELLVLETATDRSGFTVPQANAIENLGLEAVRTQFLGYLNGQPCIAAEVTDGEILPAGMSWQNLRALYGALSGGGLLGGGSSEELFAIAARAVQIVEWDRTHQYCGHCATPTTQLPTERAKRCPNCRHRQYPQLSPAVIMLIYKGDQILLARAPRFRTGMYSVLAGFVEPGESLEETVAREVKEEVGIEIKNIRYFGSQPWPFPKSLMIGFVAEYAGGTITPDPAEIEAAAWFDRHELPPVPGALSIARKLIDAFVAQTLSVG